MDNSDKLYRLLRAKNSPLLIEENTMIGYVTLGSNDLPRAFAFYDALLAELGATRTFDSESFVAWSVRRHPAIAITDRKSTRLNSSHG